MFGSSEGTRVVRDAIGRDTGARKSVYKLPPAYINKEGTGLGRDGTVAYDSLKETLQDAGLLPPDIPGQPARGMEDEIIDILEKNDYIDRAAFDEWDIKKRDIDNKISRLEEAGHNPWKMSNDEVEEALSMIDVEDIRIEAGADEAAAIQRQRDEFNRANARLEEEFKAQGIRPQTLSDTIDTSTSVPMAIREQQALRMIEPEDTIANTSVEAIKQSRRAGNINLEKLDTPDDIKNFLRDVANNNDAFKAATRFGYKMGSKGEELKSLAEASGLTVDQLLKRKKGDAFNAETAYAARMILVQSAKELIAMAKKVRGANAGNVDKIEFEKALATHSAIQEQVAGITAEAGRALRGFREMVDAEGAVQENLIKDYMNIRAVKDGTPDALDQIAKGIADFDNVGQVSHFTKDMFKPKWIDYIQEAWINSLLSGPSTHIVNMTSNAIVATSRPFEYALASMIGAIKRNPDRITGGEVAARTLGTIFGALDGLMAGTRALINPDSVLDPLTHLELRRKKSIPTWAGGGLVRLPGRALVAEDVLFKSVGYRQELWGLAVRKAQKEGKGMKRAFEIMKDPRVEFPEIHMKAIDMGRYQTFTNPLEKYGQTIQSGIHQWPFLRFIAPFIRTPLNIIKYAFERTPFGYSMKRFKDAMDAGGPEGDLAKAKIYLGTSIMAGVGFLAAGGQITGRGPSNYREKQVLMQTGWQPYSIKVGDTYYSYNRFEPVGIHFGIAADIYEIYDQLDKGEQEEADKIVAMLIGSFTENISNKSFLTGMADSVKVIYEPDRYGAKSIQRFLGSFVPTFAYYERKDADPYLRDVQNISDAFVNRVSGKTGQQFTKGLAALGVIDQKYSGLTSKDLSFKRNVLGDPKKYSPPAKFKHSPVRASKIKNDPVYEEFVRLGYTPTVPSRMSGSVKMNSEQYDSLLSYQQNVFMLRAQLEAVIKSAAYKSSITYAKKATLDEIIRKNQEKARQLLLVQYPDLIQQDIQSDLAEVLQ